MKKTTTKSTYRIRNWPEYNRSLRQRGSLDVWIDERTLADWYRVEQTGTVGRPRHYSYTAILTTLTLATVFHLPLRAAQGFVASIIAKMVHATIDIPDYTTLCRRRKTLLVNVRTTCQSPDPLHLVVDSTGLKIFGDGEWKVRQHGYSKRRTWRKLHLAVDAKRHEIQAAEVTGNDKHDSKLLAPLLREIREPVAAVYADGAYDYRLCYNVLHAKSIAAIIPPRHNARIWQHGNMKANRLSRDQAVRRIRQIGRKGWKIESGYHLRSLAETAMYRIKTIFGDHLSSRTFTCQKAEALMRCRALNIMSGLGMPHSYVRG